MRYITIHASATFPSMDIGAAEIRRWHADPPPRGNGWRDIGYHHIIRRDGTLERGRPETQTGAHVGGYNTGNVGICLVGGLREGTQQPEDNFTPMQWKALHRLVSRLHRKYPEAIIMGHNGFPGHESRGCPCFDWREWREDFLATVGETHVELPSHWLAEVDLEGAQA